MTTNQAKLYKETAAKIAEVKGNAREIAILVDAREYAIRKNISLAAAEKIVRSNVEQIENGTHSYVATINFGMVK